MESIDGSIDYRNEFRRNVIKYESVTKSKYITLIYQASWNRFSRR